LCIEISGITIVVISTVLIISLVLLAARNLHYFEITAGSLIVRNHLLPWQQQVFPFDNIRDARLNMGEVRGPFRLAFSTNSRIVHSFGADTLSIDDFNFLVEAINLQLKYKHQS
jgi:hypothetical protein